MADYLKNEDIEVLFSQWSAKTSDWDTLFHYIELIAEHMCDRVIRYYPAVASREDVIQTVVCSAIGKFQSGRIAHKTGGGKAFNFITSVVYRELLTIMATWRKEGRVEPLQIEDENHHPVTYNDEPWDCVLSREEIDMIYTPTHTFGVARKNARHVYVTIDEEDKKYIEGKKPTLLYSTPGKYYVRVGVEYLHRLIKQPGPGEAVIFRDGNARNLTKKNLFCVPKNDIPHYTCRPTNRLMGVSYHVRAMVRLCGKPISPKPYYTAVIKKGRKKYSLGSFTNHVDAATAFDWASWYIYGDNAALNYPENIDMYTRGVIPQEILDKLH